MVNRQINRRDRDADRGGFDYRPTDPKKLKERAERRGGGFETFLTGGFQMFRAKSGENAIRICPPTWKGHDHFGLEIWVHGFIGFEKASYLCPKKMLGKKCPICEAAAELLSAGEKEDSDEVKAKQKILYWIIDREGDTSDPQPWAMSGQFDQEVSGRCNKRNGKVLEVDNPWEGHDITFRRTGQKKMTRYVNVDVDPDRTPLADRQKETQRILDFLNDNPLDKILKYRDYETLKTAIDGKGGKDADDEDEDEDDKKASRRRDQDEDGEQDTRRSRRSSRDEDDEDTSRDRPKRNRSRDADEDEEEAPRRSSRTREEDEDDDAPRKRRSRDDDEDDDDRPRRRNREDDDDDDGGKRGSRRSSEDDEDEDDRSSRSRNKRERQDDEDDDRPRGRRSRDADDEDEEKPRPRLARRVVAKEDAEDEEDMPQGRSRRSRDEDMDEQLPSSRRATRNRD